ncbi:MAG: MFS transporter [Actinoplanes sp.]
MLLTPYRDTLALPGMKSLMVVATLARIPIAAGAVTLTLHVVDELDRGYGAAGLVGAVLTIGGSIGAPVMGRLVDRRGLRPVLLLTTIAEVLFWFLSPALPYWGLLAVALIGGFLALPAFSVARQSVAALTPESLRLPAFALDSIFTELSFMTGPALAVLIATTAGPTPAMYTIGGGILVSGVGLYLLNPPVRAAHEASIADTVRVPRRSWLSPRFIAVLAATSAATLVLAGTDVSVVAVLRDNDELGWAGAVMSLWAFYSLLGGFAYGTVKRAFSPIIILVPMAVITMLVSLGSAHWWMLALLLIPAGALCAPLITSTADAISRMTPASARGEAMGLHNSALTVGVALGGPLAGFAADSLSPPWGFVAVGGAGVLIALAVLPAEFRHRRSVAADATAAPDMAPAADSPAADRPSSDRPAADRPGSDRPGSDRPAADRLGSGGPTADRPGSDKLAADRPGSDELAAERPGSDGLAVVVSAADVAAARVAAGSTPHLPSQPTSSSSSSAAHR